MTEENVKKREWVKNAAIIFLSVLLVLTFFSNTFMNYSLPEVSTQYVMSGSINTKIRGNGTVSANEEYSVETEFGRKVETVCVQVGQNVSAGDVLFIFGESDSDELEQAKETLYDMELAYQKQLLQASVESGSNLGREVDEARENLSKAKKKAAELKPSVTGSEAAVKSAKAVLDEKIKYKEENRLEEKYSESVAAIDTLTGDEAVSEEIKRYQQLYAEAEENFDSANAERAKYPADSEEYNKYDSAATEWKKAMDNYSAELLRLSSESENLKNVYNSLYEDMISAKEALDFADSEIAEAQAAYDTASANLESYNEKAEAYKAAVDEVENAQKNLSIALDNLEAQLKADEIAEKIQDLDFSDMKRDIEKQREKVAELSGSGDGNEITAKVGGKITEINVKAGETAEAGTSLAMIELSDRGYTVSIQVTAEQAKKVSIGDTAEVSTYWWGSQISAVLTDIKNDAQSGGRNKFLIFDLSGDVEPGMNVDIAVGQRSQNYEAIVPNSAVRSDSNGSFVLIITTKNSPLGNRYTATRVDVQVLAKDDINSAVSGIGNGEYVITTSSAPIESGMLVRMAEG
ncbi:MAG: HlyD family efflux transporter periplasmic adaptor subunit [Oscillospiraceae bacterium]|nr:HlyD family efflux transporter periplasmic adaptor subunit [Oscillospiraceae bacterium]